MMNVIDNTVMPNYLSGVTGKRYPAPKHTPGMYWLTEKRRQKKKQKQKQKQTNKKIQV